MKDKRREILLKKRTRKAAQMANPGAKSRYQKKTARKHGRGRIDPNWQWWMDRVVVAQKAA